MSDEAFEKMLKEIEALSDNSDPVVMMAKMFAEDSKARREEMKMMRADLEYLKKGGEQDMFTKSLGVEGVTPADIAAFDATKITGTPFTYGKVKESFDAEPEAKELYINGLKAFKSAPPATAEAAQEEDQSGFSPTPQASRSRDATPAASSALDHDLDVANFLNDRTDYL